MTELDKDCVLDATTPPDTAATSDAATPQDVAVTPDAATPQDVADRKRDVEPSVKKLLLDKKDISGNKVTKVLACGNEYVIYEIEADSIGDTLKVFISGYTDESEKILTTKFAHVKKKYTEARGLLYRSKNFGTMKNRIANTISSIFIIDGTDGNTQFQELIDEVNTENENIITRKTFYILPSIFLVLLVIITAIGLTPWQSKEKYILNMFIIALSTSLGGSLSILHGLPSVKFDEVNNRWWYIVSGFERIFLAGIASSIALIIIKSKILLQTVVSENPWAITSILILASFSESLVPSMLGKIEKKT